MGQYSISQDYYTRLVQQHGKAGADAIVRKEGWSVDVPEADFTPVGATLASTVPESPTGGLGGGTGMDGEYGNDGEGDDELPVGGLGLATGVGEKNAYNAYQAAQKRVDAQIKANIDLLTGAQNRLRERRMGPTNAEKWFSIAAALGKPTRTGAFGESLGNLNEALAAQQALKRKAQEERDALLEQYGLKIGSENLRMLTAGANQAGQVYRAEAAAASAARKAAQPTYEYDDITGKIREVPKQVASPMTRQDYEALPVGTYYRVPFGPDKGDIVRKKANEKFGG